MAMVWFAIKGIIEGDETTMTTLLLARRGLFMFSNSLKFCNCLSHMAVFYMIRFAAIKSAWDVEMHS